MNKRVTKIFSMMVAAVIFFSGCSGEKASKTASSKDRVSIVTSFYPVFIHTINITRDIPNIEVTNMTQPQTGCLHDYQLTPQDIKTLEDARIFIINGAGMESFLDKVIEQLPALKVVDASKGVELLSEDVHDEVNPHVWTSISGAISQVKSIAEQLAECDRKNADKYRNNAANYIKKLQAQKDKMHEALEGIKNRNIVTFHEAFPYFAREFDLNIVAVIEREPGSEPGARELADTVEKVKQTGVKALFAEPQYPSKAAETIARETGARVYILDPAVTGTADPRDFDAYIRIMDNNLKVLEEALK